MMSLIIVYLLLHLLITKKNIQWLALFSSSSQVINMLNSASKCSVEHKSDRIITLDFDERLGLLSHETG